MTLNVYDFDDTLFRIPSHIQAPKDFDISDIHYWYDHPRSLDDDQYIIQLIRTTADTLYQSYGKLDVKNILITRRIPELEPQIKYLLDKYDLRFDEINLIGHESHKIHSLMRNIKMGTGLKEVNIYEDSLYQVYEYHAFLNNIADNIMKFNYFFVDKTHLLQVHKFDASSLGKLILEIK